MARRFTIFVLLGPFLIWLQYMILQVPDLIRNPDGAPLGFFGLVLVIVAMLGVVPGFVLGGVDHLMARRALSRVMRAVVCGVLGYPATLRPAGGSGSGTSACAASTTTFSSAGLFGVISAALCSWLAGRGRGAADANPPAAQ